MSAKKRKIRATEVHGRTCPPKTKPAKKKIRRRAMATARTTSSPRFSKTLAHRPFDPKKHAGLPHARGPRASRLRQLRHPRPPPSESRRRLGKLGALGASSGRCMKKTTADVVSRSQRTSSATRSDVVRTATHSIGDTRWSCWTNKRYLIEGQGKAARLRSALHSRILFGRLPGQTNSPHM